MTSGVVTLRQVEPGDEELLYRIYASTRTEEIALVPWDDAEKDAFLRAQFNAQTRWYHEHYVGANWAIVLVDDEPCGRFYVFHGGTEIRIMDIALLPEHHGGGIGSSLLRDLLADADTEGRRVTIHVERLNPARRLYARLGFSVAEDKGVYLLLERRSAT